MTGVRIILGLGIIESKYAPFLDQLSMNKCNQIYGVDISKKLLDILDPKENHSQFKN